MNAVQTCDVVVIGAGSAGLVFVVVSVLFGKDLFGIIGEEYVPASTLLSLLLLAASFDLASAPLRAAARVSAAGEARMRRPRRSPERRGRPPGGRLSWQRLGRSL